MTDDFSKQERDALKELDDAIEKFGEPDAATMQAIDQMHAESLAGAPAPSMFRREQGNDTEARVDAAQGIPEEGRIAQAAPVGDTIDEKLDRIGDALERILAIMES